MELLEDRRLMVGDITGNVFHDVNANGTDDSVDDGLAGWTLFVDTNGDGLKNPGEPTAVTDSKGRYEFRGLPAGPTTVYEELQPGYIPTPGFSDHETIDVRDGRRVRLKFPNVTGAPPSGTVIGNLYQDSNFNGVRDPLEETLEGWQVFLDFDGNGALTPGEPTTTTDTDGDYLFAGVPEGPVSVYEIPQSGMVPVTPGLFPLVGATDHQSVVVAVGGTARADFANMFPNVGTIRGTVWNDANGDTIHGAGESALGGRTVFVDLNANNVPDAGEPQRISDVDGLYAFEGLRAGAYRVTELLPDGWATADGHPSTVLTSVLVGGDRIVNFNDFIPVNGSISGILYNDVDGDGVQSAGESPLAGWQIYIDLNRNGVPDVDDPQATTDASGQYAFVDLAYGNYQLREIIPAGWEGWNPGGGVANVRLLNGQDHQFDFSNREQIGTIRGTVWNDVNGDGQAAATDLGVDGRTVFVDLNANGALDVDEPMVLSGADGTYELTRIPNGTYSVVNVVPEGWVSAVETSSSVTVTITTGSVKVADYYTLQPVNGSISGNVWFDNDSDRIQSVTEPVIQGMTLYVDVNGNGIQDPDEPLGITDAAGVYEIADVPYGNQTVRSLNPDGLIPTNRAGGFATLLVLSGEAVGGVDFGYREPTEFTISGFVYHDADGNGVRDLGEKGLSGITMYLDINGNAALDPGEPTTVTLQDQFFTPAISEAGKYSFTHLARGTYTVREIVPAELERTALASRERVVTVGPTSQLAVDFANLYRANEIHGSVFDDTDDDQIRDAGEYGRPGVAVYIDMDRDNVYDVGEPTTETDAEGAYHFYDLTPGAYVVRELGEGVGPRTYPTTTGGILWPDGTDHPAVGNVTPTLIATSLGQGDRYTETVSLTLPNTGGLTDLVDVFLLFDDTGSFTANSPIVRAAFPEIIATLQAAMPTVDFGFGVGRLEEYGGFAAEFPEGRPFILNQPIVASTTTGFTTSIQSALDRVAPGYGGDQPETTIEALFQVVTGLGFDGNDNGSVLDSGPAGLASTQVTESPSGDVPNFASFTADPANNVLPADGNIGGVGFRPGALPVILTATDTGFAYQPKGETSVTGLGGLSLPLSALTQTARPTTPFDSGAGIQETVTALNALGALVVGLGTNSVATADPRLGLESLARLTGAVNQSVNTIANGTADPIEPGDPLYFQISSGFGATVANGITDAIANAVTNVALNITVQASDPSVHIINHTGTLAGLAAGATASFDIEFVGDGRPHRFDLQFVREGTNVVIGSIPVVLGTPIVGDGYHYDDLDNGEVHQSSHFGHYVPNVAPSFVAGPDQSITDVDGAQQILGWATDIDAGGITESGQTLTFDVTVDNPALFIVPPTVSADGTLAYETVPGVSGSALVTVVLHDDGGRGPSGIDTSLPQTFNITIVNANNAPIAADDIYSVDQDTTLDVSAASGVLTNDTDADLDPLSAGLVSLPTNGSITLNSDGSFTYTPTPGFAGTDSFSYVANDGVLGSNPATVTITVNETLFPPVASDDVFAGSEDTALSGNVLVNDTDANGDVLTAAIVDSPVNGTVTLNADGSFTYVPFANQSGGDSFTYVANDGTSNSGIATVSITIAAVNDAPTAVGESYSTAEDTVLSIASPGLLANDSDIDSTALSIIPVTSPLRGTLSIGAGGSFVYTPQANFNGPDSFAYRVSDGALTSEIVTVTLIVDAVNDLPTVVSDRYTVTTGETLDVPAAGVLSNDSDVDGDALTVQLSISPTNGTVVIDPDGAFRYTPSVGFVGIDSFTYVASDGIGQSTEAVVTIDVADVVPGTKFHVVDAASLSTFQYAADGLSLSSHALDGANAKPRGIASNADGTLQWVVDQRGEVYVYNGDGGFLGQWRVDRVGSPEGITVWGNDLWIVDANNDNVHRFVGGANFRSGRVEANSTFPLNGANRDATDIVTDGEHLWVVNDTTGLDSVFRYTISGTLEGFWDLSSTNPSPTGITLDPNDVSHLWTVDASTDRVYQYDSATSRLSGSQEPSVSFALATNNSDPQGIADPLPRRRTGGSVGRVIDHENDRLESIETSVLKTIGFTSPVEHVGFQRVMDWAAESESESDEDLLELLALDAVISKRDRSHG
ncbi:MAG: tandem-95 repeat protein [Planctomycetales bacterium]|nr:tandem-95 repeat protein [Planctomycetales bacterium]